jgi:hypothetical protein
VGRGARRVSNTRLAPRFFVSRSGRTLVLLGRLAHLGLAIGLAGAALLLLGRWAGGASAAGSPPAAPNLPNAVTFTVTTSLDAGDDVLTDTVCHNAIDGKCSLRAAVQQLDAGAGGAISLPAGTYTLTSDSDGDL